MKALGVPTKLGGMALGVHNSGVRVIGTVEPDVSGRVLRWRKLWFGWAMPPVLDRAPDGPVDLVFGNPKCSLFSDMTNRRQSVARPSDQLTSHGLPLISLLRIALDHQPQVIWIENGPRMMGDQGTTLIEEIKRFLQDRYPYDFRVLVDNRLWGNPQARQRTQLVLSTKPIVYDPPTPSAETMITVGTYVSVRTKGYPYPPHVFQGNRKAKRVLLETNGDPLKFVHEWKRLQRGGELRSFASLQPQIVRRGSYAATAVLHRVNVWDEPDPRLWYFHEYLALMGYPMPEVDPGLPTVPMLKAISQSVSPPIAQAVMTHLILPTLNS